MKVTCLINIRNSKFLGSVRVQVQEQHSASSAKFWHYFSDNNHDINQWEWSKAKLFLLSFNMKISSFWNTNSLVAWKRLENWQINKMATRLEWTCWHELLSGMDNETTVTGLATKPDHLTFHLALLLIILLKENLFLGLVYLSSCTKINNIPLLNDISCYIPDIRLRGISRRKSEFLVAIKRPEKYNIINTNEQLIVFVNEIKKTYNRNGCFFMTTLRIPPQHWYFIDSLSRANLETCSSRLQEAPLKLSIKIPKFRRKFTMLSSRERPV